ncbi:hypothetical protein Tco_0731457 [Tanacetum coccineum]
MLLSNNDLKGTRTECGFKRAFATLFGQDVETFTGTMFQNMDQLEKQLDNEEFQEIGSMAAFKMQTTVEKVNTSKALDASLVDTESSGTELKEQDTSSRSANDAHEDDAYIRHIYDEEPMAEVQMTAKIKSQSNIRPIYDEEPMAEVQTTAEINVFATGQHHTEQLEFNNEGEVDQNAKKGHDTRPLSAKLTNNQTTKISNQSLESENICLKKTVAQFQNDFLRMEAHCVNLELKYQNQALKEGQHGQFSKVKRKPVLQPHRNQSVVRQPTAFKSERPRISKPRFASQVDVNKDLPKPVTLHYFLKERESAFAKPHHVIASSNFRNSLKNMPRFSSNDMVHNHYLAEAKNKTQDTRRRWKPTGKIFKTVVLRWVPTGKIFTSSTTKVDSEPTNGSNEDITNQYECEKLLMSVQHHGRLLERFQEDAKYENVGQDTRSQCGKDDQDKQGKDLEISKAKMKLKTM